MSVLSTSLSAIIKFPLIALRSCVLALANSATLDGAAIVSVGASFVPVMVIVTTFSAIAFGELLSATRTV